MSYTANAYSARASVELYPSVYGDVMLSVKVRGEKDAVVWLSPPDAQDLANGLYKAAAEAEMQREGTGPRAGRADE